jgi:hypothetical protein
MDEKDFTEIRKWLDYGTIAREAKDFGITSNAAYIIWSRRKRCPNHPFIQRLMSKAIEKKATVKGSVQRLNQLDA